MHSDTKTERRVCYRTKNCTKLQIDSCTICPERISQFIISAIIPIIDILRIIGRTTVIDIINSHCKPQINTVFYIGRYIKIIRIYASLFLASITVCITIPTYRSFICTLFVLKRTNTNQFRTHSHYPQIRIIHLIRTIRTWTATIIIINVIQF